MATVALVLSDYCDLERTTTHNISSVPATEQEQTTTFENNMGEWKVSHSSYADPSRHTTDMPMCSLADFFARPIQIATFTWTPAVAFTVQRLAVWDTFFTNPRVSNRLSNFALADCKLHVKFQINGNGFYHGRLMVDWLPFADNDSLTSTSDNNYAAVGASQRLKIFLDPTTSAGGEMEIPFLYYRNNMSVLDADWSSLGKVNIRSLATLYNTNGSTVPITITVYAWVTDLHLSVPTTVNAYGLTAQTEESSETVTQKVSSTVAELAGHLSSAPVIGPYARAAGVVARGVGQTARLFGFSRPASQEENHPMKPGYYSSLALTDAGDASNKLTVTSRQEVTVDPRVAGANLGDELLIADMAARESFVDSYTWSTTQATGVLIRNIRVQPFAAPLESSTYYHLPACALATLPFRYWRGTMRYRFVVCSSAFHRGRLRFVWDPLYIAGAGMPELNLGFTKVVDLETDREVTIDVPWGQPDPFKPRPNTMATWTNYSSSTRYSSVNNNSNGVLGVFIQNTLTTANDTASTVTILVFVSCVDLEVAQPNEPGFQEYVNAYSYTPQAGEEVVEGSAPEPECDSASTEMGMVASVPRLFDIFFGEKVVSFRQLLKRYTFHSGYSSTTSAPPTPPYLWSICATDFPAFKGYSSSALHRTTLAKKINYVNQTLLHLLAPAFVGARGGLRSKYHFTTTSGESGCNTMEVLRAPEVTTIGETTTSVTFTSASTFAKDMIALRDAGFNGSLATAPEKQPVLEVEFPYYKPTRFDLTKDIDLSYNLTTRPGFGLGQNRHIIVVGISGSGKAQLYRHVAVAEDFTLLSFQGCPPLAAFPTATLPAPAVT